MKLGLIGKTGPAVTICKKVPNSTVTEPEPAETRPQQEGGDQSPESTLGSGRWTEKLWEDVIR